MEYYVHLSDDTISKLNGGSSGGESDFSTCKLSTLLSESQLENVVSRFCIIIDDDRLSTEFGFGMLEDDIPVVDDVVLYKNKAEFWVDFEDITTANITATGDITINIDTDYNELTGVITGDCELTISGGDK